MQSIFSFFRPRMSSSSSVLTAAISEDGDIQQAADRLPPISMFSIAQLMLHSTISAASFGAQFAPVPGLDSAFSVLKGIIKTVENVQRNRGVPSFASTSSLK